MWETILLSTAITVLVFIKHLWTGKSIMSEQSGESENTVVNRHWQYLKMKDLVHEDRISLPALFVDLDVLDCNVKTLVKMAKPSGKTIRIATKSVRCPEIIQRILGKGEGIIKGLMCFSVYEASFLAKKYEMDNFFIPYPTVQISDIKTAFELTQEGKFICLTVDSVIQVAAIDKIYQSIVKTTQLKNPKPIRLAIDLDMSLKIGPVILGPHRSRIATVKQFGIVVDAIEGRKNLKLSGVMGYEAHVAGLPDDNPFSSLPNALIRFMKPLFFRKDVNFRKDILKYCFKKGIALEFFNGSGSGNLQDACDMDNAITEVTAGSAFLQAKLFDYYVDNKCSPGFCFGLQCTRIAKDYVCCQSGGFVASGSCSLDKFPIPFANPLILEHFKDEGYGEVQTPLQIKGEAEMKRTIDIGDPIFFRPAKSGEIAEHFNTYYLKKGYDIVGQTKTYRGLGQAFY